MSDLIYCSVGRLAEGIHNREFSCQEVVQAHIDRIVEVNPRLNAVVNLLGQEALEQALILDRELSLGNYRGPLHGIPCTIKDNIEVAGVRSCSAGMKSRALYVPKNDATIVARLRKAGAVFLGITNMPKLGLATQTDNAVYGRTNNPYNFERTPGGSSGGEAAIVAAGGVAFGLGSDIGGSIRQPAHHCGIVGLKPTSGRVPRTGHFPGIGGSTYRWAQSGPLARSVQDAAIVLRVIAGPDGIDPEAKPLPLTLGRAKKKKFKAAFYMDNGQFQLHPPIYQVITEAAAFLQSQGVVAEYALPPGCEDVLDLFLGILGGDGGERLQLAREEPEDLLYEKALGILKNFRAPSVKKYEDRLIAVDKLRSNMLQFFEEGGYDVIVCPVTATPAREHADDFADLPAIRYTALYNLTGLPAIAVPSRLTDDGLPIGVQVVGKPFQEGTMFAVASLLEQHFGFLRPNI